MEKIEDLHFLKYRQIYEIAERWGTPVFVYSEDLLNQKADETLAFNAPYGLTVRYAMKANPNRNILKVFNKRGICIDASSGFESERAMIAGYLPNNILLTSQEIPNNLKELINRGIQYNACSLNQLENYGKLFPGSTISLRLNPGLGSGHSNKTNVGGPSSSFGIWHEYIDQIKEIVNRCNLTVIRIHTHIGSGNDPEVWTKAAKLSLNQIQKFPNVKILNLGGGFKVARMKDEIFTDLKTVGNVVAQNIRDFYKKTGRKLHLEIEPGTYLVANTGSLISTIKDMVDTGKDGYKFLKIDSGMTDILRPNLYAAQHPLVVVNDKSELQEYIVVGHCCESGDILTPDPDDPEALLPRLLKKANIGDRLVIEGVGAYGAYMSAQNYNSFPTSPEVMVKVNGYYQEISRRENLQQIINLEV